MVRDVIDKQVVLPVTALSLFACFCLRVDTEAGGSFAERQLGALRNKLGGHPTTENCG